MRLATPCLFLALLGVSLVTGAELDRPRNLRRGLADGLSVATSGETKALNVPAVVSVGVGAKESDPWDEPDTPDSTNGNDNKALQSNGDKAADMTTLPTDGVVVNGAKEADPWDEPDSEDGNPPSSQKDGQAGNKGETQAVLATGEGGKAVEPAGAAVQEGSKHEEGGYGGRGPRGRYDDDYNDDGWRYGGDRRFDRCVRYCQQHCYNSGRYRYCPNRCYGWCHHQLGW